MVIRIYIGLVGYPSFFFFLFPLLNLFNEKPKGQGITHNFKSIVILTIPFNAMYSKCLIQNTSFQIGKVKMLWGSEAQILQENHRAWAWEEANINASLYSLVAQLVKNQCAMQETWVQSLGWEDPLEKGKATHSSTLVWRIPWTLSPWGLKVLDTTEWLSLLLYFLH